VSIWPFAALAAAAGLWWTIRSTHAVLHPNRRAYPKLDPEPSIEPTAIARPDGSAIEASLLRPQQPKALILACHGYHGSREQILPIAAGLSSRGYAVLLFDLAGHGTRPGPCTFGLRDIDDIALMLHWARRHPEVDRLPIGFFGYSLGGAVGCHAASRFQDIKALVADATYARLRPAITHNIWRRYHLPGPLWGWLTWLGLHVALRRRLGRVDPIRLAEQLRIPALFIHGSDDLTIPVADGKRLYERWRGPKSQWIKAGAAHVGTYAMDPEEYVKRVAAFFDQWLSDQRIPSRS
jgi:hypothetical protein